MTSWGRPEARPLFLFTLACVVAIVLEVYVVLLDRESTFEIRGEQVYDIAEFAEGRTVTHAFLMRGDGMHAVSVRLTSSAPTSARLRWTLWHSYAEAFRAPMSRAFNGETDVTVTPEGSWVTFDVTRDGSSNNRWYTLDVQLVNAPPVGAEPSTAPRVSLVASRDNPERGGILWVNGVRQTGSLMLRADRHGRTLYRRFEAEALPNLPRVFRNELVQWLIAAVAHWAFFTYAYALTVGSAPPRHADGR